MSELAFNEQQEKFFYYWKRSLLWHCGIIVLVVLLSKINFFVFLSPNPKIISSSVRVDIVELPKYTLEELKKMELAPAPKVIADEKLGKDADIKNDQETDISQKEDSDIEEIFKKIKKQATLSKNKNDKKKTKDTLVREKELNELVLAGNKLMKGSLITGEEKDDKPTPFEQYILEATEKVRSNWKLPTYLKNQPMKCRIQVFINSQGSIELTKIMESSGNEEFDSWAMKAIEDSLPFTSPDSAIVSELLRGRFILGFPL